MHFENTFVLNKKHFAECFDESESFNGKKTPRTLFMAALVIIGVAIIAYTNKEQILGYFLIALSILEFFSFKYRRAWWVLRQNWSRNAGNTIKLTIDEQGITINSLYLNTSQDWQNIVQLNETDKGIILMLKKGGQSYLSKSTLNAEVITFMQSKIG